jgi:ADP-heptose:LPS heptosyltransferase
MDELETLIFRTDRIGDFIISCPFIKSYKKKYPHNSITLISSEHNFNHINKFEFISKTIPLKAKIKLFPKLIILVKMIINLRRKKYKDIIILDGKARSFFISFFLKGKKSILLQSKKILLISKLLGYKFVINNEIQSQLKNFSFLANILGFKILDKNPNIYKNLILPEKFKFKDDYMILHLDEKWYSSLYYSDFTDINPTTNEIETFIYKILDILNNKFNLIITTGNKKIESLSNYVSTFTSDDKVIHKKIIKDKIVIYLNNISFEQLASLVSNSSFLICCEGAISHLSNNFNIPTLALYEKKRIQHTIFWTGHMNKISLFERKKMNNLLLDNDFFNKIETKIKNS